VSNVRPSVKLWPLPVPVAIWQEPVSDAMTDFGSSAGKEKPIRLSRMMRC